MTMRRLLPALLAACATTTSSAPPSDRTESGFPTRSSLEKLRSVPPPASQRKPRYLDVESWELVGPFPEGAPMQVRAAEKPWDALVDAAVAKRPGALATASMACAARELGRFQLLKSASPAPSLQSFVLARCGSMVSNARLVWLNGETPEEMSDAEIFAGWRGQIEELLAKIPEDPNQEIGVWFGREGKQAMFFLASGNRLAELTSFGKTAEPNRFVLEGRLLTGADNVRALINRGRFGVAECELGKVKSPAFALLCEASPEDDYAWIEIAAFPPGRLLGKTVLHALVWPRDVPANTYVRSSIGDERKVASTEDVTNGMLGAINQVREAAGMTPLILDGGQSAVATGLAEHFFAATLGTVPSEVADTIVLGLRAGWDVEGVVKYGKLTSAIGAADATVGFMASTAIERPFGREVLLDPDVRRLAVGPMVSVEEGFYAAVLATYALFEVKPNEELAPVVVDLLRQRRAEAAREPPVLFSLGDLPERVEARVASGELEPKAALDFFLSGAVQRTRRAVNGWVFEVSDLDKLEFPPDLVITPGLEMSIAVSHREPKDEPWGRYVVLIVVTKKSEVI